jgi:hypothetical protein
MLIICLSDPMHEIMEFDNQINFSDWKTSMELQTNTHFIKVTGTKKNVTRYHCQRDGSRPQPIEDVESGIFCNMHVLLSSCRKNA